MNTKHLRYLCAVAEVGSIAGAAARTGISAPAMSRAVGALSDTLGLELVVPDGRGIRVTPAARELAARVEPLLDELERTMASSGELAPASAGPLRIGTFEYCSTVLLPDVLDERDLDGGLDLHEAGPGALETLLVDRRVDLVVTTTPVARAGVDVEPVPGALEMAVFARRGRFVGVPLAELPFAAPMTVAAGTTVGLRSLDGWPLPESARSVRYRVSLLASALALVEAGRAVAWLPAQLVEAHDRHRHATRRLEQLALPEVGPAAQQVFVCWRTGEGTPAAWRLISRLGAVLDRA